MAISYRDNVTKKINTAKGGGEEKCSEMKRALISFIVSDQILKDVRGLSSQCIQTLEIHAIRTALPQYTLGIAYLYHSVFVFGIFTYYQIALSDNSHLFFLLRSFSREIHSVCSVFFLFRVGIVVVIFQFRCFLFNIRCRCLD